MLDKKIYEELLNGTRPYHIYEYPAPYRQLRKGSHVNIMPGSFNPLHNGHLAIWESIKGPKFFEISITRYGKDPYKLEILNEVLSQFHNKFPYIVTNVYDFLSKSLILRDWNINWWTGFDTSARIINMYPKCVLESMGTFFVMPREISGKVYNLSALEDKPKNFITGNLKTEQFIGISSTELRGPNNVG